MGTGCSGAKEHFIPDIVQNCQPAVITEQADSESLLLLGLNSLQIRHSFNTCTQGPPLGMSLLLGTMSTIHSPLHQAEEEGGCNLQPTP